MKRILFAMLLAVLMPSATAAEPPPARAESGAVIILGPRNGRATPVRKGCTHTGGGNIDVAQPSADTVVITMTGVAVACGAPGCPAAAALEFDLDQCFEVTFEKKDVKVARISLEARVIGLLRSHVCCKKGGLAEQSSACASILCDKVQILTVCAPTLSAALGENLSINDRNGPESAPIVPGRYSLHQAWRISAQHPACLLPCKAASAEFAPDPALDPLWISHWEPFHGAQKKDFGFQVIVKVVAE